MANIVIFGAGSGGLQEVTSTLDVTDTEAFLVRKDADGGDVLTVNTTDSQVIFADGTEALPSIRWANDADTGIYSSSAGTARFVQNGDTQWIFDGTGIAGSNSGAPVLREVNNAVNAPSYGFQGDSDTGMWKTAANTPAIVGGGVALAVFGTTVTLTAVNLKALVGTPITLVAAQGANTIIEFVSAIFMLNYGSEVLAESADNLVIEYSGGTNVSGAIEMTGFIDAAADISMFVANNHATDDILTGVINEGIRLLNTDGDFTGNASNDTTMDVKITYRVHATGF